MLEWTDTEQLAAGHQFNPSIFHLSGVAQTGGIHRPSVEVDFLKLEIVGLPGFGEVMLASPDEKTGKFGSVLASFPFTESLGCLG